MSAEDDNQEAPMKTAVFFNEMLPTIIEEREDAFNRGGEGRISVLVHGVGAWTLSFGDAKHACAVVPAPDFDADLVVTWTDAQFQRLLAGENGEDLAPLHIGDTKLLERLGTLLQPPAKGGLGARMWGM